MDNTNETEEKKASGFQDSSTSHQKSSEMSSKSYSSPTDNADEEEELEIDEVSLRRNIMACGNNSKMSKSASGSSNSSSSSRSSKSASEKKESSK